MLIFCSTKNISNDYKTNILFQIILQIMSFQVCPDLIIGKKKQDLELPLKIIDYKTKFHFCCSTERIYNFRLFPQVLNRERIYIS